MNRLIWVSIFLVFIIAGRITAQQQPAPSGDGSRGITGRVLNHNGQPLTDTKVFMRKVGELSVVRETHTGDAGEFRFENLSSGVYTLFTPGAMAGDEQQKFYRPGDFVTFRVIKGSVITGTVTDSTGRPVIAARVRALRVRDERGRRVYHAGRFSPWSGERLTDDRGVYRFWGLTPGSYLVSAGGRDGGRSNSIANSSDDTPTYHPSAATPEAATEVSVYDGQEATGIDISHHGESGHAISGYISGQEVARSPQGEGVILTQAATGALVDLKAVQTTDGSRNFVFEGLADGEYDLVALRIDGSAEPHIDAVSPRRQVVVKGKDVSGVEVKLAPLGSIEGRIVLEADRKLRCQSGRPAPLEETVIIVDSEEADPVLPIFTFPAPNVRGVPVVPDRRGNFTIRSLKAARYRVEAQLPSEDWYIRSIDLTGPAPSRPLDAGRDGIALKSGERIKGLTMTIQKGAASVGGRVVMAQANATLPVRLYAHLVPAERQQSDNVLRFAEAAVQSGGSFLLTNIAPGRYWLLARPADDLSDDSIRPLVWDREARAKLVREAAATGEIIELQPCQRRGDQMLRYAPLTPTEPKEGQSAFDYPRPGRKDRHLLMPQR